MDKLEKDDRPDIIISGNVATWELNMEGSYSGTFTGTFKFRCYVSPMQRIAIGREQRDLLGSTPGAAEPGELFLSFALPSLKYRVIEAPPFWTNATTGGYAGDILDENIIYAVMNAAVDAEVKYKKILETRKTAALMKAKDAADKLINQQAENKKKAEKQNEEFDSE